MLQLVKLLNKNPREISMERESFVDVLAEVLTLEVDGMFSWFRPLQILLEVSILFWMSNNCKIYFKTSAITTFSKKT
jgi:hypothetical protein